MKKLLCFAFGLILFAVSCGVEINPSFTLGTTPESLDFGSIQVYTKATQNIIFANTGGQNTTLTSITLELDTSTTANAEIKISTGVLTSNVLLKQYESHKVDIEFRPRSQGAKGANLKVMYRVGNKNYLKSVEIEGVGYTGFIDIQPAITDFDGLTIGSAKTKTITISNIDSQPLTINSIYIAELSSNTRVNEFSISDGWNDSSIVLEPSESHTLIIKFKPFISGSKSAKLFVKIAQSTMDFNSVLQGISYDPLVITTSATLPDADIKKSYECLIICTGGDGKYKIEIINNALPKGLVIDSLKITGIPEEKGDFEFTIQASDDFGQTAQKTFNLHVKYADLIRDPGDVDPPYTFSNTNKTGTYTVNLVAEGDYALTITKIYISGAGFSSGEATIKSKPTVPLTMQPGEKTQVIIEVNSLLDHGRSVTLTVEHTGISSPLILQFQWKLTSEINSNVYILDRGAAMSAAYSSSTTIYDKNGDVIPYPTKWQAAQYFTKVAITSLAPYDTFEIIVFNSGTMICFAALRNATTQNVNAAINWLFNINATGSDNAYNAFYAAFQNYGSVKYIHFYTDGIFTFNSYNNTQIIQTIQSWVNASSSLDKLQFIQVGGSPMYLMVTLGGLPHCEFGLK